MSNFDSINRAIVEFDLDSMTLLALTSTSFANSTVLDDEEIKWLFHTHIWVQNILLHLIVDNGSQKNLVFEYIVNKLGLGSTLHKQPYNIG